MTEANKIPKLTSAEKNLPQQQQQQNICNCLHCAKICEGEATSKFQRHLRRPPAEIGGKKNCRMKEKKKKKRHGRNDGVLTLSQKRVIQKTVVSCQRVRDSQPAPFLQIYDPITHLHPPLHYTLHQCLSLLFVIGHISMQLKILMKEQSSLVQ